MAPTVEPNDLVIVESISLLSGKLERDQIAVFDAPRPRNGHVSSIELEGILYMFRAVGIPGDIVEVRSGRLIRNGKLVEEAYLMPRKEPVSPSLDKLLDFGPYEVPENEYFFLGDNRYNSEDSRTWQGTSVKFEKIRYVVSEIRKDYYE